MQTKKHRLDKEVYKKYSSISFTISLTTCIDSALMDSVFESIESILIETSAKYSIILPVYLLMPNHMHLITNTLTEEADSLKAINMFKQKSGFKYSQSYPRTKWQRSFHDHIIRDDEDMFEHVRYILYNPVRKQLVENWKDYKYKGSQVYDLNELVL
ncbi:MAG TPA: hypothetical protein PK850_14840 [Ignavibacteria bacterium]|nr:hypothetical protein [Ignavibacteria bacterium]